MVVFIDACVVVVVEMRATRRELKLKHVLHVYHDASGRSDVVSTIAITMEDVVILRHAEKDFTVRLLVKLALISS